MLAAVKLDDEAGVQAEEISDVRTDPDLATELGVGETTAAQRLPELCLYRGGIPAQLADTLQGFGAVALFHVPSPSHSASPSGPLPLPGGEG